MSLVAPLTDAVPKEGLHSVQLQKALDDMKATAGSRFNAAKRLEANDRDLTWIVSVTSAYIIAMTILPYFWHLPKPINDVLNLSTVVFSVIILVSSLLHNSNRDAVNAEQHHRSALEIKEIHREMLARGDDVSQKMLIEYLDRYSAILQKYSVNHTDLDYKKFQADRPEQFRFLSWRMRIQTKSALMARDNFLRLCLVAITFGFLWLVFFYALPHRLA